MTYRELADNAEQLIRIAKEIHETGIPVDMEKREEHRARLDSERTARAEAFRQLTKFDGQLPQDEKTLNSGKQLAAIFYGDKGFGLTPSKHTETGAICLDKGVLRDLLGHPVVEARRAAEALLLYRQCNTTERKFIGRGYYGEPGAYGLTVLRRTGYRVGDREYGRHHPDIGICAAETMRATCNGGAQQIQKDKYKETKQPDGSYKMEIARPGARDIFVAPPGWVWFESDYAAIELKLFTLYGDIRPWQERIDQGRDLHKFNAGIYFKKDEGLVFAQERDSGKRMTFGGICYGAKAPKVWEQVVNDYPRFTLKVVEEAQEAMFKAIPRVKEYQWEAIKEAKLLGYTPLATGDRILWKFDGLPGMQFGEPKATDILNQRMQRTAAVVFNFATERVRRAVDPEKYKIVLLLHDAIHALVREDYLIEGARLTKQAMETELTWQGRRMFLNVDQMWGSSWGTAKTKVK